MQIQKAMSPIQALQLISTNLARLSGTREDHQILMQAEAVIRDVVMKAGNEKAAEQLKKPSDAPKEVPLDA